MKLGSLIATAAAATLVAAPVAAQTAPAVERSAATAEQKSELGAVSPLILLGLAAAAVGLFVIIDDGEDDPVSA